MVQSKDPALNADESNANVKGKKKDISIVLSLL